MRRRRERRDQESHRLGDRGRPDQGRDLLIRSGAGRHDADHREHRWGRGGAESRRLRQRQAHGFGLKRLPQRLWRQRHFEGRRWKRHSARRSGQGCSDLDFGRCVFVFDTRPNKRTNIDKITDFNVRDDTIHLAKSVFSKIAKKGVLAKSAIPGRDTTPRISEPPDRLRQEYRRSVHDSDGKGGHAAVQIATLQKHLKGVLAPAFLRGVGIA